MMNTNQTGYSPRGSALAAIALLVMAVAPLEAAPLERSVIGSSGEVFRVLVGTYGDLFPGGTDADPSSPVLALHIDESDGTALRLLVPGTESPHHDGSPALVYDEVAQVVHLVWETQSSYIHPVLRLASYGAGLWSEPLEIVGNAFAGKTHPLLFVTHDSTLTDSAGSGAVEVRKRTILHVVWAQEKSVGVFETLYSPIILGDGDAIFGSPVVALDNFSDLTGAAGTSMDPSTEGLTHLRAGEDARTVVIAFPSARTGRITAVKLDVLPEELARLAEEARSHIIDVGFEGSQEGLRKIADDARSHIIDVGARLGFHVEVVRSIADSARSHIIDVGAHAASDVRRVADGARSHIIDVGVKFTNRGLRRVTPASVESQLLEIATRSGIGGEHVVRVGLASSLPTPTGVGASPRLFSSPSGTDFIISWRDGEHVAYRESRGGSEWSGVRVIRLSEALTAADAYAALERRVSSF